jgi:hypothetical protein
MLSKNDEMKYTFEMKFTTEGKIAKATNKEIETALGCSVE